MNEYAKADQPSSKIWSVHRRGGIVTLEANAQGLINRYTFDLDRGGSLVLYDGVNGTQTDSYTWQHEEHNGVWVPSHMHRELMKDGKCELRLEIVLSKQAVNGTLPVETFDVKNLGVHLGDIVTDHLANTTYKYRGTASTMPSEQ